MSSGSTSLPKSKHSTDQNKEKWVSTLVQFCFQGWHSTGTTLESGRDNIQFQQFSALEDPLQGEWQVIHQKSGARSAAFASNPNQRRILHCRHNYPLLSKQKCMNALPITINNDRTIYYIYWRKNEFSDVRYISYKNWNSTNSKSCISRVIKIKGISLNSISFAELLTLSCPSFMKSLPEVIETLTDKEPENERFRDMLETLGQVAKWEIKLWRKMRWWTYNHSLPIQFVDEQDHKQISYLLAQDLQNQ